MAKRNIVLIGFMGTGKSTVGQLLAARLGWAFADTDTEIEEKEGMAIPVLFERHGEAYFRRVETDVVKELAAGQSQVIATGGGAVLAEANRAAMLDAGLVVALKADKQTIVERVSADANRPLLRGGVEARVEALLADRATAYDFAHVTIDTTGMSAEQVADAIITNIQDGGRR